MSETTDKARALLDNRLSVIDALDDANKELARARQSLRDAESTAASAWSNALSAGWTKQELRQLNFTQPPTRRGGRPKKSASTRSSKTPTVDAAEATVPT